jgi:magnesium-transporting ATPase (P-type)
MRVALEMMDFIPCGCINLMNCQADDDCIPYSFALGNRLWIDVLNTIIIAISVIVCAIPEGLPLAVTISLSYASH